ncbi:MAG: sugar-binding protein [Acetobacteraceae bacterium]|nr:sugar-binding protein [Acetobacteraceae bacterium]
MNSLLRAAAAALLAGIAGTGPAVAKDYVFALVPKNLNNPFFDQARDGCMKAAQELSAKGTDKVSCQYIGPAEHGGGEEQLQVVSDLVAKHVAGISVSSSNAAAMATALRQAKEAAIPVITFDSDLLAKDTSLRLAYVGTRNYDIGVNLAKLAQQLKPHGGTICIQSGGAAAANHNERIEGIRDTLSGHTGGKPPGERLTGQNGWREVEGCPLYTNDDFVLAVQQMEDILGKYPNLDAFIPTGGFPQFVPEAYRRVAEKYKSRIQSHALALVVADTLPAQIQLLKEGYSLGQVGQRPFEMGYKSMYMLFDAIHGKKPTDPTYTGLDVCKPDNAATCVGAGS